MLEVERSVYLPFHLIVRWTDKLPAKRRRAAYGSFFTLFSKAGSNVVESVAILMEFVAPPHERWAELAKRMTTPSTPATTPGLSGAGRSPARLVTASRDAHGVEPGDEAVVDARRDGAVDLAVEAENQRG
jgi:hypothetical protein